METVPVEASRTAATEFVFQVTERFVTLMRDKGVSSLKYRNLDSSGADEAWEIVLTERAPPKVGGYIRRGGPDATPAIPLDEEDIMGGVAPEELSAKQRAEALAREEEDLLYAAVQRNSK